MQESDDPYVKVLRRPSCSTNEVRHTTAGRHTSQFTTLHCYNAQHL